MRFQFTRSYGGIYTNRHEPFVLREEHVAELKNLSTEYNQMRRGAADPLSMSDILNGALDFAFEHPLGFSWIANSEEFRDAMAKEVYRKAFGRFAQFHELF